MLTARVSPILIDRGFTFSAIVYSVFWVTAMETYVLQCARNWLVEWDSIFSDFLPEGF